MAKHTLKINGNIYEVEVGATEPGRAEVKVNGKEYSVEFDSPAPETEAAALQGPSIAAPSPAAATSAGKTVKSPLPGVLLKVLVKEGQNVKRGERIAVLEAMKMENDILSPCDGTVVSLPVAGGDSVLEGAVIAKIA